jgi:hypothetical protein
VPMTAYHHAQAPPNIQDAMLRVFCIHRSQCYIACHSTQYSEHLLLFVWALSGPNVSHALADRENITQADVHTSHPHPYLRCACACLYGRGRFAHYRFVLDFF